MGSREKLAAGVVYHCIIPYVCSHSKVGRAVMLRSNSEHQQLLEALKANDKEAFLRLYLHFRKRLFATAYLIVKDTETAKDLVQDFFIDFWQNQRYQNIQAALQTYLTHSIKNRALNWKKKQEAIARLRQSMTLRRSEETPYYLEHEELNREIAKAIHELPPMASRVFELHYIERLSHKEIAEQLRISKSTVSSHLDRALKELRKKLMKFYKKG